MDEQLLHEIRSAKDAVADAEGDLVRILNEIDVARRAAKIAISDALRNAILKLRTARAPRYARGDARALPEAVTTTIPYWSAVNGRALATAVVCLALEIAARGRRRYGTATAMRIPTARSR